MARHFTRASLNKIDYAAQLFTNFTWGTIAAYFQLSTDLTVANDIHALIANTNVAATDDGFLFMVSDTDTLAYYTSPTGALTTGTTTIKPADGWVLGALTNATGGTPRFHTYKASAGTWTHVNGGIAIPDNTSVGSPVTVGSDIGPTGASMDGDLAALLVVNQRVLTDSEIERLPSGSWDRLCVRQDDVLQEFPSGRDWVSSGVASMRTNDRGRMSATTVVGTSRSASADPPGFRFSRLTRRR